MDFFFNLQKITEMITARASTLSSTWQYFALNLESNAALLSAAFTQSILSLLLYATAYMTLSDLSRKYAEWKGNTTEQGSARFSTEEDFKIYYRVSLRCSMLYVAEMEYTCLAELQEKVPL